MAEEKTKTFTVRMPESVNKKFRILLLEHGKSGQEVLLNIVKDIIDGDKELINKYIKK